MAAVVAETRKIAGLRSIRTQGTITLSGNYPAGGEPVTIPKPGTTKSAYGVRFSSVNGNQYEWDSVNQKMKAFSAIGTELAAGAYGAGYTGDTIGYEAEFPKFG